MIIVGMIIGTLLTLSVVKIIVNRSVRIFGKDLLRSLIACSVITIVFIALTVFDITGFARRVPEAEDVKSVKMDDFATFYDSFIFDGFMNKRNVNSEMQFTSPENIERIVKLHNYIIENRLYTEEIEGGAEVYDMEGEPVNIENEYIHMKYKLKDGKVLERYYYVNMDEKVAGMLDEILTSEEYREKSKISSYVNMKNINYIQITGMNDDYSDYEEEFYDEGERSYYSYGDHYEEQEISSGNIAVIENPKLIKKVFEAYDKDMGEYGYINSNKYVSKLKEIATVEIYFKKPESKKRKRISYGDESISFSISNFDENIIECLIESGYGYTVGRKKA